MVKKVEKLPDIISIKKSEKDDKSLAPSLGDTSPKDSSEPTEAETPKTGKRGVRATPTNSAKRRKN